jgi:hypothetical protein
MWLDISMGICGKHFRFFNRIDFVILEFERRRKCFFGSYPVGSVAFDSRWRQKLELRKAEFLEIHSVWKVR